MLGAQCKLSLPDQTLQTEREKARARELGAKKERKYKVRFNSDMEK